MSTFEMVGVNQLPVLAVAPREGLQNLSGANWPAAPMGANYVTYTYFDEDSAELVNIQTVAALYKAKFRHEPVRKDRNRIARLVYHINGLIPAGIITVIYVLETTSDGARWLHLVHIPPVVLPGPDPSIQDSDEGNLTSKSPTNRSPATSLPFSQTPSKSAQ